ncbi:MAG TPA: cofactor-independent phosphoglycerate mutase [Thermoleophilia bacterium]|nr:cofactor-independent phosphoglycerate mutase [Thermoleophilia bacterium]HQG55193.1 cofactor-independent phosphoglycerate mutase [Thermoleophilia bacterium]HQJ98454.1 cofactor-independent phosphoglycerate mutase [Thermoleophilia bacterium]
MTGAREAEPAADAEMARGAGSAADSAAVTGAGSAAGRAQGAPAAAVKRLVVVPDGMADEPLPELGGRTPLAVADTPAMDALARSGTVGLVWTVPDGMAPGSDVANLAVLGYDPAAVYSGRSPLEAASIGVELGPGDVAYRCNLVTVVDGVMYDHTAGHITDEDARRCVAALRAALGGGPFEFHAGVSYRTLMVWRGGRLVPCTPPHDILGRPVADFLPLSDELRDLMARGAAALAGVRPGTSIWLWGEGTAPSMPRFADLYGLRGAVVGAVDLVRGIGRYAGFDVLEVPGATGDLDTDYGAKARAALEALDDHDLVWVHVEAPDEAAHMGSLCEKIRAIERVDREVLAPLLAAVPAAAVLVLPDHQTPVRIRTHAGGPVPFVFARADGALLSSSSPAPAFSELEAERTGVFVDDGSTLMRMFLAATG